tara:strand:- start:1142 stop:1270 length:129 start_codon:yes stop_codon:yes gene_type:complete
MARIAEYDAYESSACNLQRIGSNAAYVTGVTAHFVGVYFVHR